MRRGRMTLGSLGLEGMGRKMHVRAAMYSSEEQSKGTEFSSLQILYRRAS